MGRIKLEMPDEFLFSHSLSVRINDLNYGGHTGNDTILRYMHEARMNFLSSLGIKDETSISEYIGIIVADAAVVYKSETFFDDLIDIKIAINDHHKYGFDMLYHLKNRKTNTDVAIGKTGIIFFNYKSRKIALAPTELINTIKAMPTI